ncbi:MAG: CusA/CzcA family heavy metal efflux RND transporter [Planctomycetota bacterium]|nr:CusA/CzcA family heavy metal efflux RND transporter [Planctomycetota bacterium]
MLNWIIDVSLRNRAVVLVAVGVVIAAGAWSLQYIDIDAFPDTTPVMVQVNTTAPALSPEEVEQQITFPIEQVISGLPDLEKLRSISKFGMSQVVVTFEDGTDIYFARQLIGERLATVELPEGIERPKMGPVSTGLGEVFHYVVRAEGVDITSLPKARRVEKLTELRTIHDWIIRPQMRTVAGSAEVNSWGGYEKQYQVRIDPNRVIKHGLTFDEVVTAVKENNRNVGGGNITRNAEMLLVHGIGRTVNTQQIGNIVIKAKDGVPIRVRDVADVQIGNEIRRGAVTADGKGEVVYGLGFMLMGENSHEVTNLLKAKMDEVKSSLPPGVEVETVYDRTELVDHVIGTVEQNLFEGGLLVVAVLFMFLGNLRAGLIVALAIPLSMLCAFSGMLQFGVAASLLSLGSIDFGLVVDSSVVMIENCVRRLAESPESRVQSPESRVESQNYASGSGSGLSTLDSRLSLGSRPSTLDSRLSTIREAAIEVRKPTMFGEMIIMIVYLPILTLEGVEGKLFRPMALTVIFALAGSMILSLTLMPVLASLMLPKQIEEREPFLIRWIKRAYRPVLHFTMHQKFVVIGFALCVLVVAFGLIAPNLGSEFVPKLSEGAVAINVVRLAGTDLDESIRYNTHMEQAILKEFPHEVEHVWSRIGSAEVATDPMGIELTDVFITLKPRDQWTRAKTQDELTSLIQQSLREMPGQRIAMTQPIEMRVNEMISGIRSDVAVKLFGDDFDTLVETAEDIEQVLRSIDGNADVAVEQITGQPVLQIKVRQDEIARYGVSAKQVLDLVESLGSFKLGEVYEGQLRFPLVVRLPEQYRSDPAAIGAIQISTASGERIPLQRLADINVVEGPSTITREWGYRRITVSTNIRGRDMGSFVAEAQRRIDEEVKLPPGRYHIEWGGQFENLLSAQRRLMVVVPLAIVLIFGLLFLTYRNIIDAIRVFTGVPFAWTGGIIALWIRDMPFSISAAIGFIALSGVAVLDDMLLVSTIRRLRRHGMGLEEAVETAAMTRLRPVLMTTLVAALGFVPMALNTGMGAEVQRPLATVVIGGVISSTVMSLLVLRVLYMVFAGPVGRRVERQELDVESQEMAASEAGRE